MCGLWYLPLQAAWGIALAQRVAHDALHDVRNLDSWAARTMNRRLTEQWAWDLLTSWTDKLHKQVD
jgi:hypothetical protein